MKKLKWCTECWTPNTRPRITFNSEGVCNACQWNEEKKSVDWTARMDYLRGLCDRFRGDGSSPDVVVPYSGGKDSIYVAYKMKELGMTPLLMTVLPHMETEIGAWNRKNMCPGFERLELKLDDDKYRTLAKQYFISQGRPKHPWECAISASVITQANKLGIPFIMYGEEGEAEYGGSTCQKDKWKEPASKDYLMQFYYQNGNLDWKLDYSDQTFFTQYSRFENWSPSKHGNFAVSKGMRTEPVRSCGTFTQMNQLSDKLQDLHTYMMFLKFGFGRATSDASIAIREGWADRDEALEWIENYDGEFNNKLMDEYLEYFNMTPAEFNSTLAMHANHDIMANQFKHIWQLRVWACEQRRAGTKVGLTNPSRFRY